MNIPGFLGRRQLSGLEVTSRRRGSPWRSLLEQFLCYAEDEHFVENNELGVDIPPFVCEFSRAPHSHHILAVADEDGFIKLIDTNKTASSAFIKEWPAHSNAVFDVAWSENEPKLLTASGDQTSVLWDTVQCRVISRFTGHQSSIKSVNFRRQDASVFVSGSRDGNIMLWDTRSKTRSAVSVSPCLVIANAHVPTSSTGAPKSALVGRRRGCGMKRRSSLIQGDYHKSVTCTLFQRHNIIVSAGASDGFIKLWDIRKINPTSKKEPVCWESFPYTGTSQRQHGYSSLVFDSTQSRLFASCTDDVVYVYNCTNFNKEPMCFFQGHMNSTFYVRSALSPDDRFLLSGSSDSKAYIWDINAPHAPPFTLTGHTKEVTSVTWSREDFTQLVTCSDDNTFRVWRIDRNLERESRDHQIVGKCQISEFHDIMRVTSPNSVSSPGNVTSPGCMSTKSPVNTLILKFMTRPSTYKQKIDESIDDEEKENVASDVAERDQSLESGYGSVGSNDSPCKRLKTEPDNPKETSVPPTTGSKKPLKTVTISHLLQRRHKTGNSCHGKQCSPYFSSSPVRDDNEGHVTSPETEARSLQDNKSQTKTMFDYFPPK